MLIAVFAAVLGVHSAAQRAAHFHFHFAAKSAGRAKLSLAGANCRARCGEVRDAALRGKCAGECSSLAKNARPTPTAAARGNDVAVAPGYVYDSGFSSGRCSSPCDALFGEKRAACFSGCARRAREAQAPSEMYLNLAKTACTSRCIGQPDAKSRNACVGNCDKLTWSEFANSDRYAA